jgi:predicted nucleic acid-binding protein
MATDAVGAAMCSPAGASAALLHAARASRVSLLATAPLCFEYESDCHRPEHAHAAGLDAKSVDVFVAALVALVEPVEIWFMWRPQLRDTGHELVLEAAVNGRASAIATLNRRNFHSAAERFGVEVLLPSEAIGRLR